MPDEYISRAEALTALQDSDLFNTTERQLRAIRELPASDVAPVVHGQWISWEEVGNFVPSPDRHECSVCHDAAQVLVNGIELLSTYCPNCGARMGDVTERSTNEQTNECG